MALLVLMLFGTAAFAANDFQGFPIINVLVNGKPLVTDVPAINFHGRTMLPVRAVAEALGAELAWDGAAQTVSLKSAPAPVPVANNSALEGENKKLRQQVAALEQQVSELNAKLSAIENAGKSSSAPPAPQSNVGFARTAPALIGTQLQFQQENWQGKITGKITMTEVIRGDAAWQNIKAANQFNDAPPTGMEYILAKFRFELVSIDDPNAQHRIDGLDFTAVSAEGRDYERKSVVVPDPDYDAKLYQGASHEGWTAYLINKSDKAPLLVTGRDSRGRGGLWFDVKASSSATSPTSQQTSEPTASAPVDNVPEPTLPAGLKLSSVAEFTNYMNANYGTIQTAAGPLKLTYEVLENDRSYLPMDKWVQIRYEPTLFFVDLQTKVGISAQTKADTVAKLKSHAKLTYRIVEKAFPGQKILGQYYDSWYKYPTIRSGFETRKYFTFQNYSLDKRDPMNLYGNARLTQFFWNPSMDDASF